MKTEITDNVLQEQVKQLPKEISPQRDLWQGIELAISQQPAQGKPLKRVYYPVAWAASIVFVITLSWFNLSPQSDVKAPQQSFAQVMQHDFEQQKQLMLTSLGQPDLTNLSPKMQTQLTELQEARDAIQKALAKDESNGDLLNLLRWTQKQELDLLKKLYSPQWQTI